MRLLIGFLVALILGGCAFVPPSCHTAGEDYTAADACR